MSGRKTWGGLAALCLLAACEVDTGRQGCHDLVETYVRHIADDCELGSRERIRDALESGLRQSGLSCAAVDRLADPDKFYEECLPDIVTLHCADTTSSLPTSCQGQLLMQL